MDPTATPSPIPTPVYDFTVHIDDTQFYALVVLLLVPVFFAVFRFIGRTARGGY